MYKKQFTKTGFNIILIYDDGREQEVSQDQDLYIQWLADGNIPTEIPYIETPNEDSQMSQDEQAIIKRNEAYTEYLQLCAAIGFNTKVGFSELTTALDTLEQSDFNLAIKLSIKLLAVNQKIIYYGGTWDDCPNSL